jgi:hypothetical protein
VTKQLSRKDFNPRQLLGSFCDLTIHPFNPMTRNLTGMLDDPNGKQITGLGGFAEVGRHQATYDEPPGDGTIANEARDSK